jgi:hypothetical protein
MMYYPSPDFFVATEAAAKYAKLIEPHMKLIQQMTKLNALFHPLMHQFPQRTRSTEKKPMESQPLPEPRLVLKHPLEYEQQTTLSEVQTEAFGVRWKATWQKVRHWAKELAPWIGIPGAIVGVREFLVWFEIWR